MLTSQYKNSHKIHKFDFKLSRKTVNIWYVQVVSINLGCGKSEKYS